ncbi:uncharacterized protein TRIADDRAFT_28418 [Trichoplax adhaerens]|uniref:PACRG-like protein n=1 Tax=Trichoplax adhaerens TaxID=10228 RepID=B3S2S2_TRIAD|nr:hypothetical protein TRIADDRAFT_28418 [Trichoplax adhaerens]EDV22669.1 hypothetical protein TRIADDRAFT_28418 [Trichoplax adhaerens]|eukprot:XP_002114535.1 hypothetical protein TRIADDRAFT_28418 [Trichoplax adhaerens]
MDTSSKRSEINKCKSRPSDRLNPKTVDPFSAKVRHKTTFSAAYVNGGIPCRLVHGSVKHTLQWSTSPEDLPYDPLLVTMMEGLRETVHPFTFIVKHGLRDLLQADRASMKIIPLLSQLIPPLRQALQEQSITIFDACLQTLQLLSDAAGSELNVHLKTLLPQLSKRMFNKDHMGLISSTLQCLERNGGKVAFMIIKAKVPTYTSMCS